LLELCKQLSDEGGKNWITQNDENNWTIRMVATQSRNPWTLEQLTAVPCSCSTPVIPPTAWTINYTSTSIELEDDGIGILYPGQHFTASPDTIGNCLGRTELACSVTGNHPFPPGDLGPNYFEISISECPKPKLSYVVAAYLGS
jgi:hypothetical protein